MATINLLPWREELRAERKKEFIARLSADGSGGDLHSLCH